MNPLLFIPVILNLAQSFIVFENNGSNSKGQVDNTEIISYNLEDGEAFMSGNARQNQSSFGIDDDYLLADELLKSDTDIQSHYHSTPEGMSPSENTLVNTRVKRASRSQKHSNKGQRKRNEMRNKANKTTYNSAYFVIDHEAQDGHMTYDCRTQAPGTAKEIRCWKEKSVPGTESSSPDFTKFDAANGRVNVTKDGLYHVFVQMTFKDSRAVLANKDRADLFKNYNQFSLNIGQIIQKCRNPETKIIKFEQRYRMCYVGWTGPILKDQQVYVENAMGTWLIEHDEKYTFWGITKLDSWVRNF